jgi:hypothetical protein
MPDDQPYYGSWFLRVDRFADVHVVAAQNKNQSCMLASIKMIVFKVNKLRPGKAALPTESRIEALYKQFEGNPNHDFDTTGSNRAIATQVLNALGIGNWATEYPSTPAVPEKIMKYVGVDQFGLGLTGINAAKRGYPVLLRCTWKSGRAHAIVCDTVTQIPLLGTYATICDPWDGDVHFEKMEKGKTMTYEPSEAIGINFWGSTKADAKGIGGVGTIDAITYCQKAPGFWS